MVLQHLLYGMQQGAAVGGREQPPCPSPTPRTHSLIAHSRSLVCAMRKRRFPISISPRHEPGPRGRSPHDHSNLRGASFGGLAVDCACMRCFRGRAGRRTPGVDAPGRCCSAMRNGVFVCSTCMHYALRSMVLGTLSIGTYQSLALRPCPCRLQLFVVFSFSA